MTKKFIKFTAWLIYTVIIYLLFTFINLNFNPLEWGDYTRIVSGILFTVITIFYIIAE